jgi:hypothetical protein
MADANDKYDEVSVFHAIENPIISYSNPEKTVPVSQLFGILRVWIPAESHDFGVHSLQNRSRERP